MDDDFVSSLGIAFTAHRLRRLSDALVEACGNWFAEQGLKAPPRSASTLRLLAGNERLSITEIAARLRLSHPFIVRLVSDLERLGLVEIERDAADRRRRFARLTPKGRLEARASARTSGPVAKAYSSLAEDAGVDLLAVLDALERAQGARSMRERLEDASPSPIIKDDL